MTDTKIRRHLFAKEWRLAMHPTAYFIECMTLMLLIPDYPYFLTYFYATLNVFFICLIGRENRDVEYTALLPVDRRDIVGARFSLCILLELIMIGVSAIFAALRPSLGMLTNDAGMVPNAAFFGFAFLLLGIFNLLFFPMYYKNTRKIGIPYTIAAVVFACMMVLIMGAVMIPESPFQLLDGYDRENAGPRILVLLLGAVLFGLLTFVAFRISVKRFSKEDIS